jgi:hypothetical protein
MGDVNNTAKVLADCLLALKEEPEAPTAALSLLKTYCKFDNALCFALGNGSYKSYITLNIALGGNVVVIPRDKLPLPKNGMNRIGPGKLLKLKDVRAESTLWACPLTGENPARFLFMAASVPGAAFKAELLETALREAGEVLIPQGAQKRSADRGRREGQNAVMEALLKYSRTAPAFQGIVLQTPRKPARGTPRETPEEFFRRLAFIVDSFARVVKLPSNDALVLLPDTRDRELISHRLSKTLNTPSLTSFESEKPEQAFSLLQPYL